MGTYYRNQALPLWRVLGGTPSKTTVGRVGGIKSVLSPIGAP